MLIKSHRSLKTMMCFYPIFIFIQKKKNNTTNYGIVIKFYTKNDPLILLCTDTVYFIKNFGHEIFFVINIINSNSLNKMNVQWKSIKITFQKKSMVEYFFEDLTQYSAN